MPRSFLLTGSNIGDRANYLIQAKDLLVQHVILEKESSIYESAAWGDQDQGHYLNQVLQVSTELSAQDLLKAILNLEQKLDRVRGKKWAARTIDIDILFYGNDTINEPGLTIPHPLIAERTFTLAPLAEIAPDLIHPVNGFSMKQMLVKSPDSGWVKKWEDHVA